MWPLSVLLFVIVLAMAIRYRIHGNTEGDRVSLMKVEDVMDHLEKATPEAVSQVYDFGKLIVAQFTGLRQSFDTKLTSCLGWSAALLAVVLVGKPEGSLPAFGAAAALGAVVLAGFGLLSVGGWKWPGELAWLDWEYFQHANQLRGQHILALVQSHQSYSVRVQKKGRLLFASQCCLLVAGVLIGAAVLMAPKIKP
jgi:hypothetical protein